MVRAVVVALFGAASVGACLLQPAIAATAKVSERRSARLLLRIVVSSVVEGVFMETP
jgi:hypothetical protein